MNTIPLSSERHGAWRLRHSAGFSFAARRAAIPLVAAELRSAAIAFPVAFTSSDGGFTPVALLGLEPDENLFVGEDGKWRGRYLPAELRSYPFTLRRADDGRQILCVTEDATWLGEGPEGMVLFTEDRKPSAVVVQALELLGKVEQNRAATAEACKALQQFNCIEPWPIVLRSESGERRIEGLFRVSESALNGLGDDAFLSARRSGGLSLAYAQLISMQQLPLLGQLAAARAQRAGQMQFGQDLDLSWLSGDTIKLGLV